MMKGPVQFDRERLENDLRKQMHLAWRAYREAAAEHTRAVEHAQACRWRLDADGHQGIHLAATVQHHALQRYLHVLRALTEVMRAGSPGKKTQIKISPAGANPLTLRETEILRLIATGLSSREIASRLKISQKTVIAHRYQLMRKLDLHDVVSLVRYAVHNKLVEL